MERVEHFHSSGPSPEPLRIKVERGQKGGYAYEVSLLAFGMLAIAMKSIRLILPKSAGGHLKSPPPAHWPAVHPALSTLADLP